MSRIFGLVQFAGLGPIQDLAARASARLQAGTEAPVRAYADDHALLLTAEVSRRHAQAGPCLSPDGRWAMLIDGEVFNLAQLQARFRPTVASGSHGLPGLLDCWAAAGPDCLPHLQGHFGLAFWDRRERTLHLATDRLGERPLFYAQYAGRFVFTNHFDALLADPELPRTLDLLAVGEFLTYEYPMDDRTLLTHVKVVPSASVMTVRDAHCRTSRYWHLRFADGPADLDAAADRLAECLDEAVAVMADDEGPVGLLLSGGLDSRVVAGFLNHRAPAVHSFTFGSPRCHDRRFARRIARRVGTCHHGLPIDPAYLLHRAADGVRYTGGMANCLHFHVLSVLDEIARHTPLVLNGVGGDVLSGNALSLAVMEARSVEDIGYRLFHYKYASACPPGRQAALFGPELHAACAPRLLPEFIDRLRQADQPTLADRCDYLNITQRQRRFIFNGNINLRSRVQTRSPFLMPRVLEAMIRVPAGLRFRQQVYTRMICRHMPALARVPRQGRGAPLAMSPLRAAVQWRWEKFRDSLQRLTVGRPRPYANYADYGRWLQGPLRPLVMDLLAAGRPHVFDLVRPARVQTLIAQHLQGAEDHGLLLGCLITLELWCRQCLNPASVP